MRKVLASTLSLTIVFALSLGVLPLQAHAATIMFLTSGSFWIVPPDWSPANNSIECLGAGGNGSAGNSTNPGAGGGGGSYAKITNQVLTPGSTVNIAVASGGCGCLSGG